MLLMVFFTHYESIGKRNKRERKRKVKILKVIHVNYAAIHKQPKPYHKQSKSTRENIVTLSKFNGDNWALIIANLITFLFSSAGIREFSHRTLRRKGQIVSDEMDVIAHLMHC